MRGGKCGFGSNRSTVWEGAPSVDGFGELASTLITLRLARLGGAGGAGIVVEVAAAEQHGGRGHGGGQHGPVVAQQLRERRHGRHLALLDRITNCIRRHRS